MSELIPCDVFVDGVSLPHVQTDRTPMPSLFIILAGTGILKLSSKGKYNNARLPGCCAEIPIVFMLKHFLV